VLQETTACVQVAILGPTPDVWSREGLDRGPFVNTPRYLHLLWQAIHQNGFSADYVNRTVLEKATFEQGRLRFGPMAYDALIVTSVQTLEPATAEAIKRYAQSGGRIVFVGKPPHRSAGLPDATQNDRQVAHAIQTALKTDSDRVLQTAEPRADQLLTWADGVMTKVGVPPSIQIEPAHERLFQIQHKLDGRDIFFLVNLHQTEGLDFDATFATQGKTPWRWDPETGERCVLRHKGKATELRLHLEPLESLLLVFESEPSGQAGEPRQAIDSEHFFAVSRPWTARFRHAVLGTEFTRPLPTLSDLAQMPDDELNTFTGTIVYRTAFEVPDKKHALLDLGEVFDVSEATLNGKALGVRWWGRHRYDASAALRQGHNVLEVKVTTTLFNYCQSLRDNGTAVRWTKGKQRVGTGLVGPVRLYEAP
jgi:hypothetical protein